ncbi:hypothetical protein C1H46_025212 [Malus baccata]|uniref:NF-X1-type domain-containing protein n=1 Tax=Malus baccata TaxID=106549 RepID=A0A540LSC6_MALBA|nr:hypothetical protein C1H46_025212 [Malus baccata]
MAGRTDSESIRVPYKNLMREAEVEMMVTDEPHHRINLNSSTSSSLRVPKGGRRPQPFTVGSTQTQTQYSFNAYSELRGRRRRTIRLGVVAFAFNSLYTDARNRTCPCGKRMHEGLSCKASVPLCGSTCDKMFSCGYHRRPEKCHRGECIETCRTFVIQYCWCGSLKNEVPCHQDLACEMKCQRLRDCVRHACKRMCCDGDCPPCSEICGRKLRCRNRKCPSPCIGEKHADDSTPDASCPESPVSQS